ncbi:MAG: hypothetical protein JRJ58_17410, partial [Deltaproteobacteria bacterium]|nr:hypothetical protein [Deltaproteobacteria bacterium]
MAMRSFDLLLVPICLISLAWEPNFSHGFINYNESGQHLATMREMARGSLLFRDLFVQYGPLHYFVPYWAAGAFGESLETLRGYFLLGEIAGFLAAWGLCRALIPSRIFASAAALVMVIEAHHTFWSARWGGFRFAFVYLSLWCLVVALNRQRPRLLFFAGAGAALAFLHTYDAGAAAGLAAAVYFIHALATRRRSAELARELTLYSLGLAVCLLPFLLYLLATETLGDYWAQLPFLNPGRAWVQPISPGVVTPTVMAPGLIYLLALVYCVQEFRDTRSERGR